MIKDCKAIRQGDQMQCPRCGLTWDVDDTERPECADKSLSDTLRAQRNAAKFRRIFKEVK